MLGRRRLALVSHRRCSGVDHCHLRRPSRREHAEITVPERTSGTRQRPEEGRQCECCAAQAPLEPDRRTCALVKGHHARCPPKRRPRRHVQVTLAADGWLERFRGTRFRNGKASRRKRRRGMRYVPHLRPAPAARANRGRGDHPDPAGASKGARRSGGAHDVLAPPRPLTTSAALPTSCGCPFG